LQIVLVLAQVVTKAKFSRGPFFFRMVKTTEKAKFSHTSNAQKLAMLNWLENQKNFKWITGSLAQDSSMTSGQKLKKIDAYQAITSHVNKITKS
jgi:hypothetical protein